MSRSNKILFSIIAVIAILACNVPGGITPTNTPDLVATITAQAALLVQPPQEGQPSQQIIVISATPAPIQSTQVVLTETPAPTATIALTSTPSVTSVTVSADTNCRSGPSKDYDYLGALLINQSAEVVGKNTITGYWIIKNPERNGNCWLWGKYATVTGDVSKLQEFAIPPTPTPSAPETPKGLTANKICFFNGVTYNLSGSISWNDGPNETGYNVYLSGGLFNVLPANATTSAIPNMALVPGGSIKLSVEAFNSAGKSGKKNIEIVCP
jgi:hypothetical protein